MITDEATAAAAGGLDPKLCTPPSGPMGTLDVLHPPEYVSR
jgi:hypothetical protein